MDWNDGIISDKINATIAGDKLAKKTIFKLSRYLNFLIEVLVLDNKKIIKDIAKAIITLNPNKIPEYLNAKLFLGFAYALSKNSCHLE